MHVAESSNICPKVKRRKLDGIQVEVACPPLLSDYQAYMRDVDRGDQLQVYYNIGRRSEKNCGAEGVPPYRGGYTQEQVLFAVRGVAHVYCACVMF